MQETHEADLHLHTELEEQMLTNQQLTAQLGEKDVRLREMEVSHRQREGELLTQLQQKDVELEQKSADISRIQRQIQWSADISKHPTEAPVSM